MKTCSKCGQQKSLDQFHSNIRQKDGRHFYCKSCSIQDRKARRHGDIVNTRTTLGVLKHCAQCGLWKEKAKDFYKNQGLVRGSGYCKDCTKDKRNHRYQELKQALLKYEKQSRRHARREMIEAYGGTCACCGESHWEFLTIDHIQGGGNNHRKSLGGQRAFMRELRRRGYPKDNYRLLCYNCNCSIGALGYCPHSLEKNGDVQTA